MKIQTCAFVPASEIFSPEELMQLAENPPNDITWGTNNRSLVDAHTLVDECLDMTDEQHCKLQLLADLGVYIDMEN